MESSSGLVQEVSDGTAKVNDILEFSWTQWVKLFVIGAFAWLCIRMFAKRRPPTPDEGIDAAQIEARRKSAWERKQERLDELVAAAIAVKQKGIRVKEDAHAAALAVKEAKEKALECSKAADEARMRRRRAGDQVRLSGNEEYRRLFEERRREAEERVKEERLASMEVERAMTRLEELRDWLNKERNSYGE